MYEHRCGRLECIYCMEVQTFVALVDTSTGEHRNFQGGKVGHITDASCRACGYVYGRKDVTTSDGSVRKHQPVIDDATALAAARALGLPPVAALYGNTEAVLAAEARAAGRVVLALMAPPAPAPPAGEPPPPAVPDIFADPPVSFDDDEPEDALATFLQQHAAAR